MIRLNAVVAVTAAAFLITGSAVPIPRAAKAGLTRTVLLREDLSTAGRETIQVRVDFDKGALAESHRHPGEELVYVLKGTLEYRLDGRPPVTLRPGDVQFIPSGTAHAVRNLGNRAASELATYIVEKGQPLITAAPLRSPGNEP